MRRACVAPGARAAAVALVPDRARTRVADDDVLEEVAGRRGGRGWAMAAQRPLAPRADPDRARGCYPRTRRTEPRAGKRARGARRARRDGARAGDRAAARRPAPPPPERPARRGWRRHAIAGAPTRPHARVRHGGDGAKARSRDPGARCGRPRTARGSGREAAARARGAGVDEGPLSAERAPSTSHVPRAQVSPPNPPAPK